MGKTTIKPSVSHDEWLKGHLSDTEQACEYLEIAIEEYREDDDTAAFLLALRNVVQAQGGFSKLAKNIGYTREHLYTALSNKGNPGFDLIGKVLHNLGLSLSIKQTTTHVT